MKFIKTLLLITISLLFVFGCSETKDDITLPPHAGIHPEGFGDASSQNFHKYVFATNEWSFNLIECQSCHASDYNGGTAGVSCLGCHTEPTGPEACNTCHGKFSDPNFISPPNDLEGNSDIGSKGVGAHFKHVYNNGLSTSLKCVECHQLTGFDGSGKIDHAHISPPPAKMEFGEFTHSDSLALSDSTLIPDYDFTNITCSNTYCHGNFKFGNIVGNNRPVVWNSTTEVEAKCGTCHGQDIDGSLSPLPVGHFGSYVITDCATCHSSVVNSDGEIIDKLKHINKEKDL